MIAIGTGGDGDASSSGSALSAEPLGRAERMTAIAVGAAAGGVGGYAVFASTNQAGTAILLILSAIFLLIGIQGTSLIRFSSGSNMVELDRKRQRVEQAVKEAAEDDVERAEGIIEGAALAMPDLRSFTFAHEMLYVRRLELAILELGYDANSTGIYLGPDIRVRDSRGAVVEIEVKYREQSPLSPKVIRDELARRPRNGLVPLLIVTNVGFSVIASSYAKDASREAPIKLITWRDESNNNSLRDALVELFGAVPILHKAVKYSDMLIASYHWDYRYSCNGNNHRRPRS